MVASKSKEHERGLDRRRESAWTRNKQPGKSSLVRRYTEEAGGSLVSGCEWKGCARSVVSPERLIAQDTQRSCCAPVGGVGAVVGGVAFAVCGGGVVLHCYK